MQSLSAQPGTDEWHISAQSLTPSKLTKRLMETLPAQITLGAFRDGRKKPFYVRSGEDRRLESFETEIQRNVRAEELARACAQNGTSVLNLTGDDVALLREMRRRFPWPTEEILSVLAKYAEQRDSTLTVKEAVDEYLRLRLAEDVVEDSSSHRQMRHHLVKWLSKEYGDRRLVSISTGDLRDLLGRVKDRDGVKPASPDTRISYRKNWNTFFGRAMREGWIKSNPCEAVVRPQARAKDKQLLSIEDAFTLLKKNLGQPVLPRIALEMWGFMRASSAGRCNDENEWETQIRFDEQALYMPGEFHKSGKSKLRQKHEPVLWEWLKLATDETWFLSERMYQERKSEAFIRAGLELSDRANHNVLRHSCISYHLAAFGDMSRTSYLAQHSSISMTQNYEGIALQKDGLLWQKLTPAAVSAATDFSSFLSQIPQEAAHK